jgi:hypothetical protein
MFLLVQFSTAFFGWGYSSVVRKKRNVLNLWTNDLLKLLASILGFLMCISFFVRMKEYSFVQLSRACQVLRPISPLNIIPA